MSMQTWQELIGSNVGVGPTVTALTITSLLPTGALIPVPVPLRVGQKFRSSARGVMNTTVTTPGTITFTINFGAVAVFVSQALALNIVAKAGVVWFLDLTHEVMSIGSGTAATIKTTGTFESEAVVGSPLPSAGGIGKLSIPAASPVAGTGFNSTVANLADLLVTQTVNNSMILHNWLIEALN